METTPNSDSQATNGPLPTTEPVTAPDAAPAANISQLRCQRVDEYEAHGLKNAPPFAGAIDAIQADLLRSSLVTGRRLHKKLAGSDLSPDGMKQVEHDMNNHLRLVRQIERLGQFELRMFEARQKAEILANKLSQGPLQAKNSVEYPPSWAAPRDK